MVMPHVDSRIQQRHHEKLWIIDGETDHGIVSPGLEHRQRILSCRPGDRISIGVTGRDRSRCGG